MKPILQRIAEETNITDGTGLASILADWRGTYLASMHPNGFMVFKIGTIEGWDIRVHVWLENCALENNKTPIHDHTSNLISLILKGKLLETRWSYLPCENGALCRHIVKYDGFSSVLSPSSETGNLNANAIEERKAGDLYRMAPYEIHSVSAREFPCVSLCLMDKKLNEGASVFSPLEINQTLTNNRAISNQEIVEQAKKEIDWAIREAGILNQGI